MAHYTPPEIKPRSTELFMSMRHTFAQLSDSQLASYRPRTDMQRSAYRQELQRRSFEVF